MPELGRTAAPRVLRLVAAGGPDAFDGEIRFHRRLTVLVDARPVLADWVASLLGARAPADTLLEIDDAPARTYDLPRALRALPAAEPVRIDTLRALANGRSATAAKAHRSHQQIAHDLDRWERVLREARRRLAQTHESAPHVDPVDLATADRLRSEWVYAHQLDAWEQTRTTEREALVRHGRFEEFLARFGASSFEDLSMVGTGFGDTRFDAAIREAAMVVSMAEQRCHKLRMELENPRLREEPLDRAGSAPDDVDVRMLDAEHVDRLLARALADLDDTAYLRPLVVDRVLDVLSPAARRRAYDRLVTHARRRQIVLVTTHDDVARWAAHESPVDAALQLGLAGSSRS